MKKILEKAASNTPLMKEIEGDLTSELKDQLIGFLRSKHSAEILNLFMADIYAKYGQKYMVVIKANTKIKQYVISLIDIKDVESFILKAGSKVKSYNVTQLSETMKDFIK